MSQDAPSYHTLCSTEYLNCQFHPSTVNPPTLFELLGLDPYAAPFHPAVEGNVRGGKTVDAAQRSILEAWARRVQPLNKKGLSARESAYRSLLNQAMTALSDIDHRAVYTSRFLRPIDAAAEDDVWQHRRRNLAVECAVFWPDHAGARNRDEPW
ncbi:hypothetical protein LY78DRAFT_686737 [Colletotrichum sublineola]|nr:hypothetical protein LY78DRAFT_686737 [Colletotrichum sublineola]